MKITKIKNYIKCDSILCNKIAEYKISANSYKGDFYMCSNCFNEFQKLFKRTNSNNEKNK